MSLVIQVLNEAIALFKKVTGLAALEKLLNRLYGGQGGGLDEVIKGVKMPPALNQDPDKPEVEDKLPPAPKLGEWPFQKSPRR